jgi:(1->4)-alpha-D-glucan 1-alpha-D-glucosylmutase
MSAERPLTSTYRVQFNHNFTFADAMQIVPYLHRLGVSHLYASPFLKARAGSPHGYDIVDHNALNPEIGDEAALTAFIETLHQHDMGLILDIVPNHMAVGGDDNAWWLDVLESGEASLQAHYFDINWHPANPALNNRVMIPFLADHYGKVLESGALKLIFDAERGSFAIRYGAHLFPIDPRSYGQILALHNGAVELSPELIEIIVACKALPRRAGLSRSRRLQRRHGIDACQQRLAQLCRDHPELLDHIHENIARFNGAPGQPESFDLLHHLLEQQAYRLAYWRVASDEINYRRFFDINDLAALRMESNDVFMATHTFIHQLIEAGVVDGLRIDHPDGLQNPGAYFNDLRQLIGVDGRFPLLVEKILMGREQLPAAWPVSGTTGYETAALLNALFVDTAAEHRFDRLYRRFTGITTEFDDLLHDHKQLIIRSALASEMTVLASVLSNIAQSDRHTRDFTYHNLRNALSEVAACFPVYRTYITTAAIGDEERRHVQWAMARAKRRSPAADLLVFDFIQSLLLLEHHDEYDAGLRRQAQQFTLAFQQYCAPVMAKGMEDTLFYIYNRLASLNDVGCDPRNFGITIDTFHQENSRRHGGQPHTMITTSTHDSKRSEDVRMRINVLSERADEWRKQVTRWSRINRKRKRLINDQRAPSRNDEWLLYQTLIGTWPLEPTDAAALEQYRQRIDGYMLKAVREAKLHTSWINPNEAYEEAVRHFVQSLLSDPERNLFLASFLPFQKKIVRHGLLNSLSQTLLKLTIPGVPDLYQGNELWSFNLVDPDNRRAVDYEQRQRMLQTLVERAESSDDLPDLMQELLQQIEDGRAKLYLIWRCLSLRRQHPQLFSEGDYRPLAATGPRCDHLCAFARSFAGVEIVIVATRWFSKLSDDEAQLQPGELLWAETSVAAPQQGGEKSYTNLLTHETVATVHEGGEFLLPVIELLKTFPLAVLLSD